MAFERFEENLKSGELFKLLFNKFNTLWQNDRSLFYWLQISQDASYPSKLDIVRHEATLCIITDGVYIFAVLSVLYFAVLAKIKKYDIINRSIIYLIMLGMVALYILTEANSRYHFTVTPLLCIIAFFESEGKHEKITRTDTDSGSALV